MAAKNNLELIGPILIAFLGATVWLSFRRRMDQKLSKNFTLPEFSSKDGAPTPENVIDNLRVLAKNLQVLRDYVKKPIKINSGYRSPAYNKKIGGATKSQHMLGRAADITIQGMTAGQVADTIEQLIAAGKMQQGGLGRYPNFVHYDIRKSRARW
jgi:uncharacterized protein YcbK (DUF882 family)